MIDKNTARLELAARFNDAFPPKGAMSDVEIAANFGISKAGVGAWRDTGRIDKKHLPKLAAPYKCNGAWRQGATSATVKHHRKTRCGGYFFVF